MCYLPLSLSLLKGGRVKVGVGLAKLTGRLLLLAFLVICVTLPNWLLTVDSEELTWVHIIFRTLFLAMRLQSADLAAALHLYLTVSNVCAQRVTFLFS